jgi:hypothetical protein
LQFGLDGRRRGQFRVSEIFSEVRSEVVLSADSEAVRVHAAAYGEARIYGYA